MPPPIDHGDRPKAKSLKPLRTLVPFIRPYRRLLIAALAALLVASAAMLALPVALRFLIDNGFATNDVETVNRYFGWFFAAAAAFGAFAALRFYLVTSLGERVVADIRRAVFARVIHMDPTFFEVTRTGEVLSRLTTDTTLVQSISGVSLSIALRSALNLLGGVIMLALTSFKLTLYILLGVPAVVLPMIIVGRRIRRLSRDAQDRVADTSGVADESLHAIQTVQAYTLEGMQKQRFNEAVAASLWAALRRHSHARRINCTGHHPGVRRHHVHSLDGIPGGAFRRYEWRPAGPVPYVLGVCRRFHGGAERALGRHPKRCGRHGAVDRTPAVTPRNHCACRAPRAG